MGVYYKHWVHDIHVSFFFTLYKIPFFYLTRYLTSLFVISTLIFLTSSFLYPPSLLSLPSPPLLSTSLSPFPPLHFSPSLPFPSSPLLSLPTLPLHFSLSSSLTLNVGYSRSFDSNFSGRRIGSIRYIWRK